MLPSFSAPGPLDLFVDFAGDVPLVWVWCWRSDGFWFVPIENDLMQSPVLAFRRINYYRSSTELTTVGFFFLLEGLQGAGQYKNNLLSLYKTSNITLKFCHFISLAFSCSHVTLNAWTAECYKVNKKGKRSSSSHSFVGTLTGDMFKAVRKPLEDLPSGFSVSCTSSESFVVLV